MAGKAKKGVAVAALMMMGLTGTSYAASWYYIGGKYFNTSSSAGSWDSGRFGPQGAALYTCGDVAGSLTAVVDVRLVRDIEWSPDTTQRSFKAYYNDPAACTTPGFWGSRGESYYTQVIWQRVGSYDGWVHTKYYK